MGNANQGVNLDSADAYNTLFRKKLINLSDPTASLLYVEIKAGFMPLTPYKQLPADSINIVLEWIEQGAKND